MSGIKLQNFCPTGFAVTFFSRRSNLSLCINLMRLNLVVCSTSLRELVINFFLYFKFKFKYIHDDDMIIRTNMSRLRSEKDPNLKFDPNLIASLCLERCQLRTRNTKSSQDDSRRCSEETQSKRSWRKGANQSATGARTDKMYLGHLTQRFSCRYCTDGSAYVYSLLISER